MSDKEKKIQQTLTEAIPKMTDTQRSYLLGYGDAVLDMRQQETGEREKEVQTVG